MSVPGREQLQITVWITTQADVNHDDMISATHSPN